MAQYNAKCPNCKVDIFVDSNKEANICPNCKEAFITEKAIKLYQLDSEDERQVRAIRKRHMFKSFLMGFWMVFKCIFYLFYVLLCLWLFFDIVDDIKKK